MLYLIFYLLLNLPLYDSSTSSSEILVLKSLYNLTNGQSWRWRGPIGQWDFTTTIVDPCGYAWQGIKCNKPTTQCLSSLCTITKISLDHYLLRGKLPNDWRNLNSLTSLDLSVNRINGNLPNLLPPTLAILRFQVNFLTGPFPTSYSSLTRLVYLDIESNRLSGSLPSTIGDLRSLEIFAADRNNFTNNIPKEFGKLQNLRRLDMERNSFTGIIPTEIYAISSLQFIDLFHNDISGTISSLIGNLTTLRYLNVGTNIMNGSLPVDLGNLPLLTFFKLSKNSFTSTLPDGLWSRTNLTVLDVATNLFEGSVPENLSSLSNLAYLALQGNLFEGTIPQSVGDLTDLIDINLSGNNFDGSLPSEIGKLKKLTTIEISDNHFTGSIPSTIGGLQSLTWLELQDNQFNGSIPHEIGSLQNLRFIILTNCQLTGPFPCSSLINLTSITYIDTSLNFLSGSLCSEFGHLETLENFFSAFNFHTGTIPDELGLLPNLQTVELLYNDLSGKIPPSLGGLTELLVLSLAHNHLQGTIPSQIGALRKLEQLYLQKNNLKGKLHPLVWQSRNLSLVNLDLSANRFSGSLHPELFMIPKIETLAMTSNCITGTLPEEICLAKSLSVMSLDGLGVGRGCDVEFSTIYPQWRTTWGTIPNCVWSMNNLTVISMSGNGYGGTISSIDSSAKLINLTLSHNHMTGTIPTSIQSYPFVSLDLSYNKFTGEASHFTIPTDITFRRILEVNRLSGSLHQVSSGNQNYLKPYTMNFLNGNIFGCTHLPRTDKDYSNYLCGSQELDSSLMICGSLIGSLFLALLLLSFFKTFILRKFETLQNFATIQVIQESLQSLYQYYIYFDSKELLGEDGLIGTSKSPLLHVQSFSLSFRHLKFTAIIILVVGLIVCLPIYILKGLESGEYRTHTHLYRWMWTTAYIKGVLPASLLLVAWIVTAFILLIMVKQMLQHRAPEFLLQRKSSIGQFEDLSNIEMYTHLFRVGMMILVNTAIVGVVNGFFIYSTLQDMTETSRFWIEISVSVFKIIWNSWILPFVTRKYQRRKSPSLLAKLTLFNTIFIPCIAATFTSTSCFQGVLVPPREITSTYSYATCFAYAGFRRIVSGDYLSWCLSYTDVAVEVEPFRPHFYYNNLCGSTILHVYIPIYLYIYSILLVFPPITLYLLAKYVDYESLPQWMRYIVPAILWPISSEETIRDSVASVKPRDLSESSPMLFKRDNIAVSLMLHISILITFGLCSPILGFAITTVICLSITQWRIIIARFVTLRSQHTERLSRNLGISQEDEVISLLDLVVGNTATCFQSMLWSVLWTSCLFFAFLCWDIASDTVGWVPSCWIPITAFCSMPLMRFCYIAIQKYKYSLRIASLLERSWMKLRETSFSIFQRTTGDHSNSDSPVIPMRPSEFGELNPLRQTNLEMVPTSLSVTLPSPSQSISNSSVISVDNGQIRQTI